jgi:hypothetical protein
VPDDFTDWKNETDVVLRSVMGDESPLYKKFRAVRYSPAAFTAGTDFAPYKREGVRKVVSLLKAAKRDLELAEESKQSALAASAPAVIPAWRDRRTSSPEYQDGYNVWAMQLGAGTFTFGQVKNGILWAMPGLSEEEKAAVPRPCNFSQAYTSDEP